MNPERKNNAKERAYRFALEIIKLVQTLEKAGVAADVIARQVMRSGTSIGANITEAHYGSSRKDFSNFLRHALKSARETSFWLELLRDSKISIGQRNQIRVLILESDELAKMLSASVLTLKREK